MIPSNDALLLIGHGSSRYADAGRWLHQHADALRSEGHFAETAGGLLRGTPSITEALGRLKAPVVRAVPFFMEDGYFTRTAVRDALIKAWQRPDGTLLYGPPVGVHPAIATLIATRIEQSCPDPSSWSVILVGHGSARAPGRGMALHRHRASLMASGRFAYVGIAFLEEPPFVADVVSGLHGAKIAVMGVFAGDGGHPRDDLPALAASARALRDEALPLLEIGSIGDDPAMRAIIADQAAAAEKLMPGDIDSSLAV